MVDGGKNVASKMGSRHWTPISQHLLNLELFVANQILGLDQLRSRKYG